MDARVLITCVLALAACEKQSQLYCEKHPTDLENCGYLDAGIDARPTCAGDPDCAGSPGAPYCEPTAHFCVECYETAHCTDPAKPFCDLDTFRCSSCVSHADCASAACLPDGVCGDDTTVAYVDPKADPSSTTCTLAQPCTTIVAALATMRPVVKLLDNVVESVPAISGRTVTLLGGPNLSLTRAMGGVILTITASDVSIYDLEIIGNDEKGLVIDGSTVRLSGITVTGCNHKDRRAIDAKDSTFIMTRSTVHSNSGGGIIANDGTTYNITNSFIYRNGKDDAAVGGASLGATSTGFNRFEMNTVVDNVAKLASVGGVSCAFALRAPNNLIARNYTGTLVNGATSNTDAVGGCNFTDSMIATDISSFAFTMPDGPGPWDYHVGPGSMAIDRGVMSDIGVDFDGQPRPQGTLPDVGADEYRP